MREVATSVIVPAFNVAGTLARALQSALDQDPPPLEVIVVDDGSTDDTEAVARSFGNRIKFLAQPNAGAAAARNRGLEAARGEYVAFLDADDYWLPGFIAVGQDFLRSRPEAVAVSVGRELIKLSGSRVVLPALVAESAADGRSAFLIDNFFQFWGEHDHVCTGSWMIRRRIIEAAGRQLGSLRVCEDLEYVAYLATFGQWGFAPKVLWVGDSERATAKTGWFKKQCVRQQFCPTVEQWQDRILPRLKPEDWPGFVRVRGRVAAILAQISLQGRRLETARRIVQVYGRGMPQVWSTHVMRLGAASGSLGWRLACGIIRLRQFQNGRAHERINQGKP
jgi:Glycosyl transferase family 2